MTPSWKKIIWEEWSQINVGLSLDVYMFIDINKLIEDKSFSFIDDGHNNYLVRGLQK